MVANVVRNSPLLNRVWEMRADEKVVVQIQEIYIQADCLVPLCGKKTKHGALPCTCNSTALTAHHFLVQVSK